MAKKNGLEGFYFFALVQEQRNALRIKANFDIIVYDALQDSYNSYWRSRIKIRTRNIIVNYLHKPYIKKYEDYVNEAHNLFCKHPDWIPCIDPDFDHTPRSAERWVIMHGSNPKDFGRLCYDTQKTILVRNNGNDLLFIKAWNEWGEGNYMEPDRKWGKEYIKEFRKAVDGINLSSI